MAQFQHIQHTFTSLYHTLQHVQQQRLTQRPPISALPDATLAHILSMLHAEQRCRTKSVPRRILTATCTPLAWQYEATLLVRPEISSLRSLLGCRSLHVSASFPASRYHELSCLHASLHELDVRYDDMQELDVLRHTVQGTHMHSNNTTGQEQGHTQTQTQAQTQPLRLRVLHVHIVHYHFSPETTSARVSALVSFIDACVPSLSSLRLTWLPHCSSHSLCRC